MYEIEVTPELARRIIKLINEIRELDRQIAESNEKPVVDSLLLLYDCGKES